MVADPALLLLADIRTEVTQLMVFASDAHASVSRVAAAMFTEVEDRLFVLSASIDLLRNDLLEPRDVTALRAQLEADIACCAHLVERVRQREDALRVREAIAANYHPSQVSVDLEAGVTVVTGPPIAATADVERRPANVLQFPDAFTRAIWRLGREACDDLPKGAA